MHRGRALFHQRLGGVAQRARGIDDIVDQHAAPVLDVADNVHDFGNAGLFAPLVDDRQVCVQPLGQPAGAQHAANVRRHDHQVIAVELFLDVLDHHRGAVEVVRRDVEKSLDLAGMQVQRQHSVGAGLGYQVGHQFRRNRRPGARFTVLAGVAEIGNDGGDAPGRTATERIQRHQQLHQVVVGGKRRRLDNENVLAADVLLDLDEYLHVRKPPHGGFGQGQVDIGGNRLGQGTIAVT